MPRRELTRRLHREFARYQFRLRAEILWQSRKVWGTVTDVSRGGLFIEMSDIPCMGARFTAHLALNEPLRLDCIVRRVVPDLGIGVALSIPEQSRRRFQALLLALSSGADPATTSVQIPRMEPPHVSAAAAKA
ncbi:MAG: PilZ domain-containing protein [Candidatus Acidiferrales bacterium]